MSKQHDKWLSTYAHFILDSTTRRIYEEDFIKYFGSKDIDMFKAIYFQSIVDINVKVLEVGDEVYYVFGTSLNKGIIEEIEPLDFGRSEPRIKIRGKKKLLHSFVMAKI
jgi:hypothetical protein